MAVLPNLILENGWRIKGLHPSCVTGEYRISDNPVDIACIIFGDYSNEYHLAYIGVNSGNLDLLGDNINKILRLNNLQTYSWFENTNGKSAHIR